MEVSHHAYMHLEGRRTDPSTPWNWHNSLDREARMAILRAPGKLNLAKFAAVGAFKEAPMRRHLLTVTRGTMMEVELPLDDQMRKELDGWIKPVWVAECLHMIGYYILARWLGAQENDVFWIHGANAQIRPIGFANRNESAGHHLCPPMHVFDRNYGVEWIEDVMKSTVFHFTLGHQFEQRGREISINKFKVSDRVEVPHDDETCVLTPAIVVKVVGRRVRLEYSKADIDKDELIEKDNLWKDMNDDLIYPVGFAETHGLPMNATKKYRAHVAPIGKAIREKSRHVPYGPDDVTPSTIDQGKRNINLVGESTVWQAGMVCEMIDPLDKCQSALKAARVIKVLPRGYIHIGPEGEDILTDSLYLHQTSPLLFPCGFAEEHGIRLMGPKDEIEEEEEEKSNEDEDEEAKEKKKEKKKKFDWDDLLDDHPAYEMAPDHFFCQAIESDNPFKVDDRLEAIDQVEKLLCPVTVRAVKGRLVVVGFDGWGKHCDHLYDFRSNDLFPCGWSELMGYPLQKPEDRDREGELVATQVSADEELEVESEVESAEDEESEEESGEEEENEEEEESEGNEYELVSDMERVELPDEDVLGEDFESSSEDESPQSPQQSPLILVESSDDDDIVFLN